MRTGRIIGFIIAILIGVAGGMYLGWRFYPAEITDTEFYELRADYKTDFVLMVAEGYAVDGDLAQAIGLLDRLEPGDPLSAVNQAVASAEKLGYSDWETTFIVELQKGMEEQLPLGNAE